MYSGNGKVIEAKKTGTKISEHSNWKWEGEARRYLDDNDTISDNSSESTTTETITSTNPSVFDKLSNALSQVFTGYTNNMIFGDEYKGIDWDQVNGITRTITTSDSGSSSSSSSSGGIASSLDDAIAQKATEMIIRSESGGDYSSCNNDVNASTGASISPSVGIMQWRGASARRIMQEMYNKLPNDPDAKYFATWNWNSEAPWSGSQRARLKNYLNRNHAITKTIQDNLAKEHVANNLVSRVNKYSNKLDNPSAKVFMAEIGNTGPALIDRYLGSYTGPKSNFEGFYNHFMRNSYWGPKSIYKTRLTRSYNELKNWTPNYAGKGPDEADIISMLDDSAFQLPETKLIVGGMGPDNISVRTPQISKASSIISGGMGPVETTINAPINGVETNDNGIVSLLDSPSSNMVRVGPTTDTNNTTEERIIDNPHFRKTEPTDIEKLISNSVITRSEIRNAKSNFGMGSDIDLSNVLKTNTPTAGMNAITDISTVDSPAQNQAMKKALRDTNIYNNRSQELLQNAVDVLTAIGVNTSDTAKGVNKFNDKDFSVKVVSNGTSGAATNNIVIPGNSGGNNVNIQQEKNDAGKKNNLNRAMMIAKGIF